MLKKTTKPVRGYTTQSAYAWPVRRHTCGYLPSRRALPLPQDRYFSIPLRAGAELARAAGYKVYPYERSPTPAITGLDVERRG